MNEISIRKLAVRTLLVTLCLLLILSPFYYSPTTAKATTQGDPRYGGTMRVGITYDVGSWNPFLHWHEGAYHNNVFNKLMTHDELFNVQGNLLTKYPTITSEPGYPSIYTLELEHNIHWSDGTPLTTKDVKFTLETYTWAAQNRDDCPDPEINDRLAVPAFKGNQYLSNLKKIEIIDDYIIKFYFSEIQLDLWMYPINGFFVLPYHMYKDFNVNNPPGMTWEDNPLNDMPVCSGPFTVREHVRDQYVIMDRNVNYFRGIPFLEHLVFHVIPDAKSCVLALENGEIDATTDTVAWPIEDILRLNAMTEFTVSANAYPAPYRLTINHHPDAKKIWPWLDEVNVLKAFEYALDKETLCKQVLFGVVEPTYTAMPGSVKPYSAEYNTEEFGYTGPWKIEKRTYNVDKARQLLDDAGWKLNAQGVREKNGVTMDNLKFAILTRDVTTAEAINRYFEDVGIIIEIVPIETITFYVGLEDSPTGIMNEELGGPFTMAYGCMGSGPDPDRIRAWSAPRPESFPWTTGTNNFGFYNNPRVGELLEQGRYSTVYSDRKVIYDEVQYWIHEDVSVILLWPVWDTMGWNNDFAGLKSIRPYSAFGSFFRGNDSSSNVDKGAYWRGGSPTPFPETPMTTIVTQVTQVTTQVPEFMDIRILAALSLLMLTGVFVYSRRRRED